MTLKQLKHKYMAEGAKIGYKRALNEKISYDYPWPDKGKERSITTNASNYVRYAFANVNEVTSSKFVSLSRKCQALLNKAWNIKWAHKNGTEEDIKNCAGKALELMENARPEIERELEQAIEKILSYYDDAVSAVEDVAMSGEEITPFKHR